MAPAFSTYLNPNSKRFSGNNPTKGVNGYHKDQDHVASRHERPSIS
jgi:hypothetical protein